MSTNHISRVTKEAADQKMIDGTNKHLSQLGSLPVGNGTCTPAQIVQMLQERIATSQAVTAVSAQRAATVKADKEKRAQHAPVTKAFRRMVQGMFAESPDILESFGLAPLKVATKTVATKSDAVAKAAATRAARHTMGPKQRAKITGATAGEGSATPSSGASTQGSTTPIATPQPAAAPAAGSAATPGTQPNATR